MALVLLPGVVMVMSMAVAMASIPENTYVTYEHGDPAHKVILVAPHGGNEKPGGIDNRHHGCVTGGVCEYVQGCSVQTTVRNCPVKTKKEVKTQEILQVVSNVLMQQRSWSAYRILSELHRSKMDASREFNQATFGDPIAAAAYTVFHQRVQEAVDQVSRGVMIVFHGVSTFSHPEERFELGYRLNSELLDDPSGEIHNARKSSFCALLKEKCNIDTNYTCINDVIRGSNSLGQLLANKNPGKDVVPSMNVPGPAGAAYFYSGFAANTYGSQYDKTGIDVLHLEIPRDLRGSQTYAGFGNKLAQALIEFLDAHYM